MTEKDKLSIDNSEIMTLSDIAQYLKVSEKTIARMAQVGDIPSAKVSNQWRFMRSVIDDWLTAKMQSASKQNLVKVVRTANKIIPITRLISPNRILLDLVSGTKESMLQQLIKPLAGTKTIVEPELFLEKLRERETMISTAIGHGIALPHVRVPEESHLKEPAIVLGICKEGAEFDSLDGEPTYIFVLICSNSDAVHLRLMAKMSLLLRNPKTIKEIRKAETEKEITSVLSNMDSELNSLIIQNSSLIDY